MGSGISRAFNWTGLTFAEQGVAALVSPRRGASLRGAHASPIREGAGLFFFCVFFFSLFL